MKVLLLGVGMQGKVALHDLVRSDGVEHITAADRDLTALQAYVREKGYGSRVECRQADAADASSLDRVFRAGFDVAVDLTPSVLSPIVAAAAVRCGVHLVNTVYTLPEVKILSEKAAAAGVTILPEFGMDPGIDLVLLGEAVRLFDRVEEVWTYGAGVPEPSAANNALKYKVTWTFEGVLRAYLRPGKVIRDGRVVEIPENRQFYPENIHELEIAGLGKMEAYPNGDALKYAELLNLDLSGLRYMGRYAFRYPGHCAFWKIMTDLHLLEDEEVEVAGQRVNKRRFLAGAIEPYIRLGDTERDLAVIRIDVRGTKDKKKKRAVFQIIDRRDLETGFTAMSRTVGYTTSIGAQMIGTGLIRKPGLLSPAADIPYAPFVRELQKRGIGVSVETD